jgi:ABC-type transporter Mla subunit MlaD
MNEERKTQLQVGFFILVGLSIVGFLVVYFGRLGEGVRDSYQLRVEFANASGILRGSEVLLAGAQVGRVATAPVILPNLDGVYVDLRIFADVKIPSASKFIIGSSGLLGDKTVQIILLPNAKDSPPIEPGATIKGSMESGGLGGLADSASEVLPSVQEAVNNLNALTVKINTEVLNADTLANIRRTVSNLEATSTKLAAASERIDQLTTTAITTMESGQATVKSAGEAAENLEKAITDIRALVKEIRTGQGVLGTLISNRTMAENLKAFISNLRQHGVLWYKDKDKEASAGGSEAEGQR